MLNRLKYINLTVILPDNRILMRKDTDYYSGNNQWDGTIEYFLNMVHDSGYAAIDLLYDRFKIKTSLGKNSKVELNSWPPVLSLNERFIIPFTAKINSHMSFQAKKSEQYHAIKFEDLLADVFRNSVYPQAGKFPKHSLTCVHVVRALHEGGVFKI